MPEAAPASGTGRPGRRVWAYVAVLAIVAAGLGVAARGLRQAEIDRGAELWQRECSRCHTLLRTLAPRDPEEWDLTVHRMADKRGSRISESEARAISRYLREANSLPAGYRRGFWSLRAGEQAAEELFAEKCGRCHDTDDIPRGLSDPGWLYWTMERDRRRDPFWISMEDFRRIFDHLHLGEVESLGDYVTAGCVDCHSHSFVGAYLLGGALPRERATLESPRALYAHRCYECHTESIVEECYPPDEWRSIVERMRDKAPDLIAVEDVEPIVDYLTGLDCEPSP